MDRSFTLQLTIIVALLVPSGVGGVAAQSAGVGGYGKKPAFMYNFARFVRWPDDSFRNDTSPIIFCILAERQFAQVLGNAVIDKIVRGRALVIRQLDGLVDTEGCHFLFVGASQRRELPKLKFSLAGAAVLTVGETEDFTKSGGIIRFTTSAGRLQFEINMDAADRAGLKISSRLLKMAAVVTSSDKGEKLIQEPISSDN